MSGPRSGAVQPLTSPLSKKPSTSNQLHPKAPQPKPTLTTLTSPKASARPPSRSPTSLQPPPSPSTSTSPHLQPPPTPSSSSSPPSSPTPPSPIFKLARAKKLFATFDVDRDHFLSPTEFRAGLTSFVASLSPSNLPPSLPPTTPSSASLPSASSSIPIPTPASSTTTTTSTASPLTPAQVDALWKETDLDLDQRISLPEFLFRFAGGPDPRTGAGGGGAGTGKVTVALQTLRRVVKDATKMGVDDLRAVLDAVYDGPHPRFKTVDLSKTEQLSSAVLKRILMQLLQAEREQAAAQRRPMEDWAQHCWNLGGLTQKDCDRLFAALDVKKSGRIDLGPIFALAAQKPGRAKGKKKAKANPDYPLTTVKEEHLRDFVTDRLYTHLLSVLPHASPPRADLRCHPPLDHWGDADVSLKGLVARRDSGYKKTLLLSERTRVVKVVRLSESGCGGGYVVYAVFRTEMTELKRMEEVWQGRVELAETEEVRAVECGVKKSWRDGEVELGGVREGDVVAGWKEHCGPWQDDEELSIPPIA